MLVKATLLSSQGNDGHRWCLSSSLSLSVGFSIQNEAMDVPGSRHSGLTTMRKLLLATLTGIKERSKCLTVLRVKPTPTRFLTNSRYTPMDNTPLHSISSVCHPWSNSCGRGDTARRTSFASISVPMIPEKN